jgi:hypothetical protein
MQVAYLSESALPPDGTPSHPCAERARRAAAAEPRVALADRAYRVVTDFAWEQPLSIGEDRPIQEALLQMRLAGVHALLVAQSDLVTGLITTYDIQGERPRRFLQHSPHPRYFEIEVGHIMTPWNRVPTLDWEHVMRIRVINIVKFFKTRSATHAVIVEYGDQGSVFVRGLISRLRLERQLRYSIDH